MNDAVKDSSGRRLEFRGNTMAGTCYMFWLPGQLIVASIETGKLEHENETVEELVGQLLVQRGRKTWTQEQLDCSFPLVRDYGDKQSAVNSLGSLWEHMSSVCERMPRCDENSKA